MTHDSMRSLVHVGNDRFFHRYISKASLQGMTLKDIWMPGRDFGSIDATASVNWMRGTNSIGRLGRNLKQRTGISELEAAALAGS